MRSINSIRFATCIVLISLSIWPDARSADEKNESTQVCVKLGLETNHPFEKVCTRNIAQVAAAKWSEQAESIHFIFLRSGNAYSSGSIKEKMDGGVFFDSGRLNFCVMELPAFRGTDAEAQSRLDSQFLSFAFAAKDKNSNFAPPKTFKSVLRNKTDFFPTDCDVVAASGDSWKKSWAKVIEQVSLDAGPNTKFGPEYKQIFTDALNDMSLAFSLTPAEVEQGRIAANDAVVERDQKRLQAQTEIAEQLNSGTDQGLAFLGLAGSSKDLCFDGADRESLLEAVKSSPEAHAMLSEWQVTDAKKYESTEDIFQATLASNCGAIAATPVEVATLRAALETRSVANVIGWAAISEAQLLAGRELVVEAKRVAEVEAKEQAERDRVAAIQREKDLAIQAERERVAAIERDKARAERAKTYPYIAIVSCTSGSAQLHILSCFNDTELKLTVNNRSKVYPAWEIESLGNTYQDGLHIELPESFSLRAQNGTRGVILGVQIVDQHRNVIFEDQATQYGVVSVGN